MREELIERLVALRGAVIDANAAVYVTASNLQVAKRRLQDLEDSILMTNMIDGKNAEIRAAQMRDFSSNERAAVVIAEDALEGAKTTLKNCLAELQIDLALVELVKVVA